MAMAENWSESVEDLLTAGDTDAAISLLESVISNLQIQTSSESYSHPQLPSALNDLARLYSSKGFSLKADQLHARASTIQHRLLHSTSSACTPESVSLFQYYYDKLLSYVTTDWEAIAERSPDELLSSQCLPGVSKISLEATKPKTPTPKRRGRGTFSYKKDELYSDNLSDKSVIDDLEDGDVSHSSERNTEKTTSTYGTRHVLVLADFPPSTKTIELEKLYENFRDRGVVIRWVNDTTALAVFRTPSIALEARNCISCPFRVYILDDNNDELINTISPKDLEPPRPRPKTSARTAQRLIAHGMGLKLPSASFGSRELRKQEGDRRNRIVTRQRLKDDAWGDDDD
ncbi:hypothetical protein CsatB_028441 [Cannabis sativa]